MDKTARLNLPLVDAAQAQKHVTVNETAALVDALLPGSVLSRSVDVPATSADGDAYIVPAGAAGAWSGEDGKVALYLNGGWVFVPAWQGWRLWVEDEAAYCVLHFDWVANLQACSPAGAAVFTEVTELDHSVAGASSLIGGAIPDKAVVIGVSGRVIEAIDGATGWSLGVAGETARYGSGYGVALNSFAEGVTGQPQTYYGATDLVLTASGGAFSGGRVRIAIHCLRIAAPAAV